MVYLQDSSDRVPHMGHAAPDDAGGFTRVYLKGDKRNKKFHADRNCPHLQPLYKWTTLRVSNLPREMAVGTRPCSHCTQDLERCFEICVLHEGIYPSQIHMPTTFNKEQWVEEHDPVWEFIEIELSPYRQMALDAAEKFGLDVDSCTIEETENGQKVLHVKKRAADRLTYSFTMELRDEPWRITQNEIYYKMGRLHGEIMQVEA